MGCEFKTIYRLGQHLIRVLLIMMMFWGTGLLTACAERFPIPWGGGADLPPPQDVSPPANQSRPVPAPRDRRRQSVEKPEISRKPPTEITVSQRPPPPPRPPGKISPSVVPPAPPFSQPQTQGKSPAASGEVRVAILLPLSGPHTALGVAMLRAAQMAVFDVADQRLTLLPYDTAGQPTKARQAAQAAQADDVQLILGPVFSAAVRAVGEQVADSKINVLAFSTDRAVGGNGVYLLGFVPRDEVNRIVLYALSQNYQRIAALVPDSPYGLRIANALQDLVPKHGGSLTRIMRYNPYGDDYATLVRRFADYDRRQAALRERKAELTAALAVGDDAATRTALEELETLETFGELPFDAVLLPEGGARLKELAPLLAFYDVDPQVVQFLGTAQWDDLSLGSEPTLVGGWYAAAPIEKRTDFANRFETLFGQPPPRLSNLAYDAVALAAVLARQKSDFSTSSLTALRGFAGVDGIFRLKKDGLVQRGLAVLEIKRQKPTVKSPAPRSFSGLR